MRKLLLHLNAVAHRGIPWLPQASSLATSIRPKEESNQATVSLVKPLTRLFLQIQDHYLKDKKD